MFAQSKGGNYSLTDGASGVADAIDFDGATDYLSRSSDLAGNADGKTFTFSAWVWLGSAAVHEYLLDINGTRFQVWREGITGKLSVVGKDSSGTKILDLSASNSYPANTFVNLLVSADLTNPSTGRVYINDGAGEDAIWTLYTNAAIDFTGTTHYIASNGSNPAKCRLSHVFLDYTYRDLSIEANRRLFITADRKPAAGQASLNPILYLPLSDPTQPGKNLGTGGDFALNGVVARSGRGPSQFNAPYSDLDGSADYLQRTSITGITNSRKITCSFAFSLDSIGGTIPLLEFGSNTSPYYRYFQVSVLAVAKIIRVIGRAPNGSTDVVNFDIPGTIYVGRNYSVVFSFDLDDVNKRHAYLNGVSAATFNTYSANDINLSISSVPAYRIGASVYSTAAFIDGRLGNVFFDTKYIDLSQPANLAKFVTGTGIDAKPADLGANGEKPFGTPPLIYLPMYGNNAGKNYGTGGDFTVNSGPFPGARGPNEFWGNKAYFDGSTGYLSRTSALTGVSDSYFMSFSVNFRLQAHDSRQVFDSYNASNAYRVYILISSSTSFTISVRSAANVTLFVVNVNFPLSTGTDYSIQFCADTRDINTFKLYLNGVSKTVTTAGMLTTGLIGWSDISKSYIGSTPTPSQFFAGWLSEFYLTTEYIDFGQEANRMKFRDAFGNPVDLAPQIAAGTLPNPAIYMRFDPANFGKNSGTGGDFTVSGTITDGGQL